MFQHRDVSAQRGFTLLELALTIAVIAVVATVIFVMVNPLELLRQSRDARRIADLEALKSSLDLYLQETSPITSPNTNLDAGTGICFSASGIANSGRIAYSAQTVTGCTENIIEGDDVNITSGTQRFSSGVGNNHCYTAVLASFLSRVDGAGWLPGVF